MEAVYSVRAGDDNEELRYSLRSLEANMPYVTGVTFIGYCPTWINKEEVKVFPTRGALAAMQSKALTRKHLQQFCEQSSIDNFIYMNDDFFALKKLDKLPVYNRGTILDHYNDAKEGSYRTAILRTAAVLETLGYKDCTSYELHLPMEFNRLCLLETFRLCELVDRRFEHVQFRTVYGNLYEVGGISVIDVKLCTSLVDWWSGSDVMFKNPTPSFEHIIKHIKESFSSPSKYEIN